MNRLRALRSRGWALALVAIAFVATHLILFHVLRRSGSSHIALPSAVVSGVVLIVLAKHAGLVVGFLRIFRNRCRRRS